MKNIALLFNDDTPTLAIEIEEIIHKLPNNKAPGYDLITNLLKNS